MNSIAINLSKQDIFQLLDNIQQKGSFGQDYFSTIDTMVSHLGHLKRTGEISDSDIAEIRNFFGQEFLENRILGAVAGMVIPENVAAYAIKKGLYVIAQNGGHLELSNRSTFVPKAW